MNINENSIIRKSTGNEKKAKQKHMHERSENKKTYRKFTCQLRSIERKKELKKLIRLPL